MPVLAIYPGSFDPITFGHLDIIERGCKLFDHVLVSVLRNPNKTPLFTIAERIEQIHRATHHLPNVSVDSFDGLTVNYAQMQGASALLRGLRVLSDFEMELQMAHTNKTLSAQVETVFLATSNEYSFLSSSLVKEVARFGGSVDRFVPAHVALDIYRCFAKTHPAPPPALGHTANGATINGAGDAARSGVDIQRELNRLEEIVLDSPRIPLSRRTLVDEEQLLEQLDLVRLNLPEAFHEAEAVARHKDEILHQAEQYAQEIIDQAERRAAQMINETGILRQAELEAQQLRQRVQQECEAAKDQTIAEIDHLRRQAQAELEEMQRQVIAECQDIQMGADHYADRVLSDMETQLAEMLRVVRNGKQQIQSAQVELPGRSSSVRAQSSGRGSRS